MSEEELKKLKEELKREILNEMTRKELVKDNAWKTVKQEFEKCFIRKVIQIQGNNTKYLML